MFSIVEKLTNEVQAYFEILIPSVVVLRKSIEDKKTLVKVKVKVEEELKPKFDVKAKLFKDLLFVC